MKILVVITTIAVFTAFTVEANLLPGDTEGQGGLSLSEPKLDNQLVEDPMERRLGKTLCRRKLGGICRRRRKPCPGHLPSQTKPGKPYCEKFHRCCHQVEPTMISTTTAAPFECTSPWFTIGEQCFLQVDEQRTWSSARTWCKEQDPPADLAQPSNLTALTVYLVENGYGSHNRWLGGSYQGSESACEGGNWFWINGSTIEDGWVDGYPYCDDYYDYDYYDYDDASECLQFNSYYIATGFRNWFCDSNRRFICERPLP